LLQPPVNRRQIILKAIQDSCSQLRGRIHQ
jgi:hypothetical protein